MSDTAITSLGNTNLRSLLIIPQNEPTQKCNTMKV